MKRYKAIKPPEDMLPMPKIEENLSGNTLEIQNLYSHIVWLKRRIEQLEELRMDDERKRL